MFERKNFSMLELFSKAMDKIPIKQIAFFILVVSGIILFAPDSFVETLGLLLWRNEYRSNVGLIFLFCLTGCIVWLFIFLINQILQSDWRYRRVARKYLKTLISREEIAFLIHNYYDPGANEFINMARVDMTNGNVTSLTAANVIYRASNMGQHGLSKWSYNLQPDVRVYLNKAIRKKRIVVGIDGYTWNL